jgi:hypothetical protein
MVPDAESFAMTGFSRRASPMELTTKEFGFRSAFCPQAGRKTMSTGMRKSRFMRCQPRRYTNWHE